MNTLKANHHKTIEQEVIELLKQLSPQNMKKATDYLAKLKEGDDTQSINSQNYTNKGGN